MRYSTYQAIVLSRFNYGEADKIITFLTKERGLIEAIAKGVRKPRAKLAGHLEPFTLASIRTVKGKSLDTLIGVETIVSIDTHSLSQSALKTAFVCCEMSKKLLNNDQANERAFVLLQSTLQALKDGLDPMLVEQYFAIKFLVAIGSQPNIEKSKQHDKYYLVYDSGLVTTVKPNSHYGIISTGTIKLWQLLQNNTLAQLEAITGTKDALLESQQLLYKYFQYHFEFEPKSIKVFQDSL